MARRTFWTLHRFSVPVPTPIVRALLAIFTIVRGAWYWALRAFIAEPAFKAYCQTYGRNVHTDIYIPWVQGRGTLVVGDDVLIDGKINIAFAARFSPNPSLTIGSGTGIGHGCSFTIGKQITIGQHCRIAAGVWMFDSPGHPADPEARQKGLSTADAEVKPITIGNNVWIGGRAVIYPGVTIGEGSIVSAAAVVAADVPPYSIVAGNPARRIGLLTSPQPTDN